MKKELLCEMKFEDADKLTEDLENYIVRIGYGKDDILLGTGVLYVPEEHKYAYIYTNAHIVKKFYSNANFHAETRSCNRKGYRDLIMNEIDENDCMPPYQLKITYMTSTINNVVTYSAEQISIRIHEDYQLEDTDIEVKNPKDVAVIRVLYEEYMSGLKPLKIAVAQEGITLYGRGFPGSKALDKKYTIHDYDQIHLYGKVSKVDNILGVLYTLDKEAIDYTPTNNNLHGLSGTGIVKYLCEFKTNEGLLLYGLFCHGYKDELAKDVWLAPAIWLFDLLSENDSDWKRPNEGIQIVCSEEYKCKIPLISEAMRKDILHSYCNRELKGLFSDPRYRLSDNTLRNIINDPVIFNSMPRCNTCKLHCEKNWKGIMLYILSLKMSGITEDNISLDNTIIKSFLNLDNIKICYVCMNGQARQQSENLLSDEEVLLSLGNTDCFDLRKTGRDTVVMVVNSDRELISVVHNSKKINSQIRLDSVSTLADEELNRYVNILDLNTLEMYPKEAYIVPLSNVRQAMNKIAKQPQDKMEKAMKGYWKNVE